VIGDVVERAGIEQGFEATPIELGSPAPVVGTLARDV
jgi:hypothetical protein